MGKQLGLIILRAIVWSNHDHLQAQLRLTQPLIKTYKGFPLNLGSVANNDLI